MSEPISVGIAGAGPWAGMFYAPILKAGPETRLAGFWSRRAEPAAALAAEHGGTAFVTFEALLDACEAVIICLAPDAQPEYAIRAGRAGKALVLEKPLASSVAEAERLVAALDDAGAPSMVMLTNRYSEHVRAFLEHAATFEAHAARGMFVSGAFLPGSPFAYGWRLERGALLDVGPHVVDLALVALGPAVEVRATGSLDRAVTLSLTHESAATSQLLISATTGIERQRVELELFGPDGMLAVNAMDPWPVELPAIIRRELAEMARTRVSHPVGARRGLALQRLIEDAERQLGR